uniref:Uncharacterized protein n=1 Tax=Tetranychus urticae TaxID=32264 RepID=T1KU99_TETUR
MRMFPGNGLTRWLWLGLNSKAFVHC